MINNTVTYPKNSPLSGLGSSTHFDTIGGRLKPILPGTAPKTAPIAPAVTTPKTNGLVTTPISSHKTGPSSPGTFNGVAINPGSDSDIANQISSITASLAAKPVKGLVSAPNQATAVAIPAPAPAPVATPQNNLSYGGLVGGIANASKPNETQTGLIKQGVNAANGNTAIADRARSIANDYGQRIAETGQKGAQFQAGQLTTGTSPVASGNAAVTAQTTAAQQQALAAGESSALQGVGYELTGQGQLQSGLNNALGASNTQQAQQLSGLNSAAGYAHPQVGSIGSVTYNPLTQGNAILGADQPGGIQGAGNLLGSFQGAQAVGAAPYNVQAQNLTALGTAETSGKAAGLQAQAAAPGQTAAQNYQTAGTAFTNAAAAGYQNSLPQYMQATTALQGAENQSQNLLTSLNGINGLSSQYANKAVNNLKNQFGDANYTNFIAALAETQQAYTQLLATTGASTPTVNGQQATAILSPNSTPAQIQAALTALHAAASAKIGPLGGQTNAYGQNLGIGGTSGGSRGNTGGTVHTSAGAVNTNW